jgi:hypothetical protein
LCEDWEENHCHIIILYHLSKSSDEALITKDISHHEASEMLMAYASLTSSTAVLLSLAAAVALSNKAFLLYLYFI